MLEVTKTVQDESGCNGKDEEVVGVVKGRGNRKGYGGGVLERFWTVVLAALWFR